MLGGFLVATGHHADGTSVDDLPALIPVDFLSDRGCGFLELGLRLREESCCVFNAMASLDVNDAASARFALGLGCPLLL